jgi:hypothetical protein
MANCFHSRNSVSSRRPLVLESLERRDLFSLAPAVIPADHFDLSGDHVVSPRDALIAINALNAADGKRLVERPELLLATPNIDVNGDGELSPIDALLIINYQNSAASEATDAAHFVLPLEYIGMSSAAQLASGNVRITQFGRSVSDFDQHGNLAGQVTVPLGAGQTIGGVTAVSASGRWLAGYQQPTGNYHSRIPSTWGPIGLWDSENSLSFHPIDFSELSTQGGITRVSDTGVALVAANGIFTYRWDATNGLTKLASLADGAGGTLTGVPGALGRDISADGSVIVGTSGDSNGPSFATRWTDPAHPQRLPDLGGISRALTVSLDGRVIGGTVYDPNQDVNVGGRPLAAVWMDGQLTILKDAEGNPLPGGVDRVVNGADGDPHKWVAFGWSGAGQFIAFSGGRTERLTDWLRENYSIDLIDPLAIVNAFIDGNRLSLVGSDNRILPLYPFEISDQTSGDPPPQLPPEANRLILISLRDEDFLAVGGTSSSSTAAPSAGVESLAVSDSLFASGTDFPLSSLPSLGRVIHLTDRW